MYPALQDLNQFLRGNRAALFTAHRGQDESDVSCRQADAFEQPHDGPRHCQLGIQRLYTIEPTRRVGLAVFGALPRPQVCWAEGCISQAVARSST